MEDGKRLYKEIPDMPPEIINAIDTGTLLLFVGAGVSKLIGFPLWIDLGRDLADVAVKEEIMSLSEKEILFSSGFTPMQIVTIICNKFDKSGKTKKGIDYVVETLTKNKIDAYVASLITKYLSAYNATIVTTNADETLEKSSSLDDRKILLSFDNYNSEYNDYSIVHLHGSIVEPEKMVFTSQQYARSYMTEEDFGRHLLELLGNKTVLFIGYGVSEFELIRYFLKNATEKGKHYFMLAGYLDKDNIKYEFDKEFYSSIGIELLPYSREKRNYNALLDVLASWNEFVQTKTLAGSIAKSNVIDSILMNAPTKASVETIEKMVNKSE